MEMGSGGLERHGKVSALESNKNAQYTICMQIGSGIFGRMGSFGVGWMVEVLVWMPPAIVFYTTHHPQSTLHYPL